MDQEEPEMFWFVVQVVLITLEGFLCYSPCGEQIRQNTLVYLLMDHQLSTEDDLVFLIVIMHHANQSAEEVLVWISAVCFSGYPLVTPEAQTLSVGHKN